MAIKTGRRSPPSWPRSSPRSSSASASAAALARTACMSACDDPGRPGERPWAARPIRQRPPADRRPGRGRPCRQAANREACAANPWARCAASTARRVSSRSPRPSPSSKVCSRRMHRTSRRRALSSPLTTAISALRPRWRRPSSGTCLRDLPRTGARGVVSVVQEPAPPYCRRLGFRTRAVAPWHGVPCHRMTADDDGGFPMLTAIQALIRAASATPVPRPRHAGGAER